MTRCIILAFYGFGFQLLIAGLALLTTSKENGLKYHGNPFAIQQSGYGKTLARLSQDTINVVWHLGIEQVNPIGHVHGEGHEHDDHDHDHDHDHDDHEHVSPAEAEMAAEFAALDPEAGISSGEAPDHDHADESVELTEEQRSQLSEAGLNPSEIHCQACADTVIQSLNKGQEVAMADLPAIHAFHEITATELAHGHDDQAHEADEEEQSCCPDCEEEPENLADAGVGEKSSDGLLLAAKDWLQDMTAARYDRTSPFAVSEMHQKAIAADIENMLLRAYKMDPTDFGVYNAYFIFLTIHELRATPAARDHARLVSRMTMLEAEKEEVDPQPWLTASMALLNLFFMEQEDYRDKKEELPVAMIEEFKQRMDYYLQRFAIARDHAKADGRWDLISEARRDAMAERERFARMSSQQFDVLIARAEDRSGTKSPAATPEPENVQLGENSGAESPQDSDL